MGRTEGGSLILAIPGMLIWSRRGLVWDYFNKKEHIYNKLYIFPFLLSGVGIKKTS